MTSTVPNLTPSGLLNYDANDRQTTDANETYDANGNTASSGSVANVYDFESKLVQRGTIAIVYDGVGNRIKKTAGGLTTKYLVDTNNLTGYAQVLDETQSGTVVRKYTYGLDLIAQTQSVGTSFYGYDGHGSVRHLTDASGTVTDTYTYDELNRLKNLDVACGTAAPGCGPSGQNLSAQYAYSLGPSGNRTGVTELTGRKVTYGYDDLYRLTSETISCGTGFPACAQQLGSIAYTYDAVGNRQSMTSTVPNLTPSGLLNYDANDRQTTAANETYDANGNTASFGSVANVYDFENKLVQRGTIAIVYDADGNRVRKTTGGLTTKYLVDTNNLTGYAQVLDEVQSNSVVRKYTYGLDLISQLNTQNSQLSFYGYDGHGSVRQLTNTSGAVTDTYTYDAFGNLLERTGSTPNLYLYAGEQLDPDLGLYYNRARYLDVRQGVLKEPLQAPLPHLPA